MEQAVRESPVPHRALALCADDCYYDVGDSQGWTEKLEKEYGARRMERCMIDDSIEAMGLVYEFPPSDKSRSGKIYVLAFRGTEVQRGSTVALKNAVTDLALAQDPKEEILMEKVARLFTEATVRMYGQVRRNRPAPVFIATGHSLGAFLATSVAVSCHQAIHCAVGFESPGSTHWQVRRAMDVWETTMSTEDFTGGKNGFSSFWGQRVLTYMGPPNIINTTLPHLGRMVRVDLPALEKRKGGPLSFVMHAALAITNTLASGCIWYGGIRTVFGVTEAVVRFTDAQQAAAVAEKRFGRFARFLEDERNANTFALIRRSLVTSGAALVLSGGIVFGYLAGRAGGALKETLDGHNMKFMIDAFDAKTGMPFSAHEMVGWPDFNTMFRSRQLTLLQRVLIEPLNPFSGTSVGVANVFSRKRLVEARVQHLPGYQEDKHPGKRTREGKRGQPPPRESEVEDVTGFGIEPELARLAREDGSYVAKSQSEVAGK
ncbi:unnamed protein product [Pedinophyceae sp. YPF-701]|nr:unnamed protein product [Pedinophyceae sp. YPF-701]